MPAPKELHRMCLYLRSDSPIRARATACVFGVVFVLSSTSCVRDSKLVPPRPEHNDSHVIRTALAGGTAEKPSGSCFREAIRLAFQEGRSRFQTCYSAFLARGARPSGRPSAKLQFRIRSGGRVEKPTAFLDPSLADPAFEKCLVRVLRELDFGKAAVELRDSAFCFVTYPLVFVIAPSAARQ
jgi:hypothetical protein